MKVVVTRQGVEIQSDSGVLVQRISEVQVPEYDLRLDADFIFEAIRNEGLDNS
jgi:hypothetical protein